MLFFQLTQCIDSFVFGSVLAVEEVVFVTAVLEIVMVEMVVLPIASMR